MLVSACICAGALVKTVDWISVFAMMLSRNRESIRRGVGVFIGDEAEW